MGAIADDSRQRAAASSVTLLSRTFRCFHCFCIFASTGSRALKTLLLFSRRPPRRITAIDTLFRRRSDRQFPAIAFSRRGVIFGFRVGRRATTFSASRSAARGY